MRRSRRRLLEAWKWCRLAVHLFVHIIISYDAERYGWHPMKTKNSGLDHSKCKNSKWKSLDLFAFFWYIYIYISSCNRLYFYLLTKRHQKRKRKMSFSTSKKKEIRYLLFSNINEWKKKQTKGICWSFLIVTKISINKKWH